MNRCKQMDRHTVASGDRQTYKSTDKQIKNDWTDVKR